MGAATPMTVEDIVQIYGLIVAVVVAVASTAFNYLSNRNQQKQNKTTALFKVFELLSEPEIRKARHLVYKTYCESGKNPNFDETAADGNPTEKRTAADKVESAMDKACALAYEGVIDEKLFSEMYGQMVVRCYRSLKKDIDKKTPNNDRYCFYFKTKAEEYEKSKLTDAQKEPYCE